MWRTTPRRWSPRCRPPARGGCGPSPAWCSAPRFRAIPPNCSPWLARSSVDAPAPPLHDPRNRWVTTNGGRTR
jgi:hypothetical protein